MVKIKSVMSVFLIVVMLLAQSGCSFLAPYHENLSIRTSEPDAKIYINNQYVGDGSIEKKVLRNQNIAISVEKPGYRTTERVINYKMSTIGMVDLVAGYFILIPFLGLLSPGSQELRMDNIFIQLDKE